MDLAEQARRAYERGRMRAALRVGLFVPALTALAMCSCSWMAASLACGAVLAPVAIYFAWRGEALGHALVPGALAGLAPFSIAIGAGLSGHACAIDGWCGFFLGACFVGGAVAGLFVASVSRQSRRELLATALIAALTGSLGCIGAGGMGLAGLALGILLGGAPVLVLRAARP